MVFILFGRRESDVKRHEHCKAMGRNTGTICASTTIVMNACQTICTTVSSDEKRMLKRKENLW